MKELRGPATTRFSDRISGSERPLSDLTEARRNALTYNTDRRRILLEHHSGTDLRRSVEAPLRQHTRSSLRSHCFRASTPELLHV